MPLVRCAQEDTSYWQWGIRPQWWLLVPRMPTCRVESPTGAQNNLPPFPRSVLVEAHPTCVRGVYSVCPFIHVAWVPLWVVKMRKARQKGRRGKRGRTGNREWGGATG